MKNLKKFILFFLLLLLCVVEGSIRWTLTEFRNISFAQIIFTLTTSETGSSTEVLLMGAINCLLIPLVVAVVLFSALSFLNRYLAQQYTFSLVWRKTGKQFHPFRCYRSWMACLLLLALIGNSLYTGLDEVGAIQYFKSIQTPTTLYEDYYIDAREVDFTAPAQKRNLIYLVLESMENTYSSQDVGGIMDTNNIPELTEIYQQNTHFSAGDQLTGFRPTAGSSWTASALTAQLLGIPLIVPTTPNAYGENGFIPGGYGLPDVLHSFGYQSSVMLGSDGNFGGRTALYQEHGVDQVLDFADAKSKGKIPEDYRVWWGYEDKKLFEFAKEELLRLAEQDEPFFFTALTADTHFPNGYLCEDCPDDLGYHHSDDLSFTDAVEQSKLSDQLGNDQYATVIRCSDTKVKEFLDWIQAQDFYENTTIIISGDHLTMDSDYLEIIPADYERTTYFTIINSALPAPAVDREFTTMDLMPTALASLGFEWEGDRLALGTNLFSSSPTLSEALTFDVFDEQIERYSHYYNDVLISAYQK